MLIFAAGPVGAASPAQRRLAVLQAGDSELPLLQNALRDQDPLVRRAAVRSLARLGGEPALKALGAASKTDSDALVRRTAILALARLTQQEARLAVLREGLNDEDEIVRLAVVDELAVQGGDQPGVSSLLVAAQGDSAERVSQRASQALWPYHQEAASVRERPEFRDLELSTVVHIDLPESGWKFHTDPRQQGHTLGWQRADFDDRQWAPIGIKKTWQSFGHDFEGVAWYRLSFALPEQPGHNGVDLVFEGVDESAWVWVNGEYGGSHDIGSAGYGQSFAVNVGEWLKWGAHNQLVVRVSKPAGKHGGIWKPVYLQVLKK